MGDRGKREAEGPQRSLTEPMDTHPNKTVRLQSVKQQILRVAACSVTGRVGQMSGTVFQAAQGEWS